MRLEAVLVRRRVAFCSLFVVLAAGSARAADDAVSLLLFGTLDAGPSAFVTTGLKAAVDRLDREGFVALASAGAGSRSERGWVPPGTAAPRLTRVTMLGSAVFGYQWFRDWGVVALYAGPEGSVETLSSAVGTAMLTPRYGLRLHGEVWARPSEGTLLTATLILGTARVDAWTRLSWGIKLWGAYLGPEASLYADDGGYRKWAFGLHATDFALGEVHLRASAGYLVETPAMHAGPYVTLAVWTPW